MKLRMILKIIFWAGIHNLGIGTLWSVKKNEYFKSESEKMK